jgi:hypothetical protein
MRDFLEDTCNSTDDNGHRTEVPVYYLKSYAKDEIASQRALAMTFASIRTRLLRKEHSQ